MKSQRKIRVVHIAHSDLAGAPARLCSALAPEVEATLFVIRDPSASSANLWLGGYPITASAPSEWELFADVCRGADILHIHNTLPQPLLSVLDSLPSNVEMLFHRHSPIGERPTFFDIPDDLSDRFARLLCVGHFHPRQKASELPMPNVVGEPLKFFPKLTRPSLIFSPSNGKTFGWARKSSHLQERSLSLLESGNALNVTRVSGIPSPALLLRRTRFHFSLDETVTGSFHQVTLEAFGAGSIPICGADDVSEIMLRNVYGVGDSDIPWIRTTAQDLADDVRSFLSNTSTRELDERIDACRQMFVDFLRPELLALRYVELYESVLGDP